jgi:excinuclease ABC subunit C
VAESPERTSERLKRRLADVPAVPGVYLMKDARGRVLYVGKAKSLRARLRSYFQDSLADTRGKVPSLVSQVADFEYIEADSEVDALLMEARLIKDIQPRFNENLRDSKLYPYLEITRGEDFPGVYVTRKRDDPKSRFYGPFTDARGLRQALHLLQRVFQFRTCTLEISVRDEKRRFQRPCLLHYIRRCTAPCAALVPRRNYRKQILLLQRFLEGKRKRVLQTLEKEMQERAAALDYEEAARLRDQVHALEALSKRGALDFFPEATQPPVVDAREGLEQLQRVFRLEQAPRNIEGVDVANLGHSDAVGSVVTFLDGRPFRSGYRRFRIKTVEGIDDYAMIGEVVERRFRRKVHEQMPMPDLLLIDGGKGHLQAARQKLEGLQVSLPAVVSIAKREEVLYSGDPPRELRLRRSAPALRILQYVRDEAHRFAVHYHHILRGKRIRARI